MIGQTISYVVALTEQTHAMHITLFTADFSVPVADKPYLQRKYKDAFLANMQRRSYLTEPGYIYLMNIPVCSQLLPAAVPVQLVISYCASGLH